MTQVNNSHRPLLPLERKPDSPRARRIAEVLRRLLAHEGELDPWLPFPQRMTTYGFGRPPRPLPIGALRILWAHGAPFTQPCPECGGMLRMVSFGGLLSIGGGRMMCASCDAEFFQPIGGLGVVAELIGATSLRGSEFAPSSMVFGGSVGSDGVELLRVLDLPPLALKEEVSVQLDNGPRVRMSFDAEPSPRGDRRTQRSWRQRWRESALLSGAALSWKHAASLPWEAKLPAIIAVTVAIIGVPPALFTGQWFGAIVVTSVALASFLACWGNPERKEIGYLAFALYALAFLLLAGHFVREMFLAS